MESIIEDMIQAIRKDRKAIEIMGAWYQSFKPISEDFKRGDLVKVSYKENKGFINIVSIEKISLPMPLCASGNITKEKIPDTTINCLIMQSVQLSKDEDISLDKATDQVLRCYNKIIS